MNSTDLFLSELSCTVSAVVDAIKLPCPISSVLLIGSATTGEICNVMGTSDIDLLILVDADTSEDKCTYIKYLLRTQLHNGPLSNKPAGLRCRYLHELAAFSRYLALQGYHLSLSIRLFATHDCFPLPDFERHAAARGEFLWVLGECLWGELRSRTNANANADIQLYLEAKNALAYLNLLLVAEGIFLPTHAQRVERWNSLQASDSKQLKVALAAKTGGKLKTTRAELTLLTEKLRQQAIEKVESLSIDTFGDDPAQFWSTASEDDTHASRINLASCICDSLATLITDIRSTKSSLVPDGCAGFLDALGSDSKRTAVSRIHAYRIKESRHSRRDWGHLLLK